MSPTLRRPTTTALILAGALAAAVPGTASAAVAHTVEPGETLWSIAAASNLTTHSLAVYNGLPDDAHVAAGTTIQVPSEAEAAAALAGNGPAAGAGSAAPAASASGAGEPDGDADDAAAGSGAPSAGAAPPALGAYVVRPGDTLSAIAARSRVAPEQIAAMNGLDPKGVLLAGTVIKLPTGSPLAGASTTVPAAPVVPSAPPQPTDQRLTASEVESIAAANGVPGDLAAAIAWQESGFNNAMVSPANARGVMQILPGTWDWVQQNLSPRTLDPASGTDNVTAGVLYLKSLLDQNGGDPAAAVAAYYQGQQSLHDYGVLPATQQYVADVLALRGRFGG